MNNDVVQEILLHLPVQTLLRFRAVSKSWRDVIDSPTFRKLHTHNNNNKGTVCLQFDFLRCDKRRCKLSIKLLDNGKPLALPHNLDDLFRYNNYFRVVGPVKGLICIYSEKYKAPAIAICNPFLGQLKILPKSPPFPHCDGDRFVGERHVGIGFDGDNNCKVVEMVHCFNHRHHQARVYSTRTDSWRELAGDNCPFEKRGFRRMRAVKSSSKNGHIAQWMVLRLEDDIIVTFDMRNEVFRVTKIVKEDSYWPTTQFLAMDGEGEGEEEESFVVVSDDDGSNGPLMVEICEKGSGLKYFKAMAKLGAMGTDYVVLKNIDWRRRREVFLYDYRAREFVGRFDSPESNSEIVEYIGSFISLE